MKTLRFLVILLLLGTALAWANDQAEQELQRRITALVDVWRNPIDQRGRLRSTRALMDIGPPAVPYLLQAFEDPDPFVRLGVPGVLRAIGPEALRQARPALIRALRDRHPAVREAALQTLSWMEPPEFREALPLLIEALDDGYNRTQMFAADALAKLGPEAKAAVPALIRMLRARYWHKQASAAHALAAIGPEARSAVPALCLMLLDEEKTARDAAAKALSRIVPESGPLLTVIRPVPEAMLCLASWL